MTTASEQMDAQLGRPPLPIRHERIPRRPSGREQAIEAATKQFDPARRKAQAAFTLYRKVVTVDVYLSLCTVALGAGLTPEQAAAGMRAVDVEGLIESRTLAGFPRFLSTLEQRVPNISAQDLERSTIGLG